MSLPVLQRLARWAGWLLVLAIVVLSAVPGNVRPHTGLPGVLEHFAVYLGVSGLLAVGYERRVAASVVALVLCLMAVNLELVQIFVPHRFASPLDAAAGASGAVIGAVLAHYFLLIWRRLFGSASA